MNTQKERFDSMLNEFDKTTKDLRSCVKELNSGIQNHKTN